MMNNTSYKDPDGFIFKHKNKVYRQINKSYKENYEKLINSGLYDCLVTKGMLIPHTEIEIELATKKDNAYKVICPKQIDFISYPYEWCFSQLKDAALLTLELQKVALNYGMSLKDANAFNIQFLNGRPVFIDTLSFETYKEGSPWIAYSQFCNCFLAPLALMKYVNVNLSQLLRTNIGGLSLDFACDILPLKARLNFGLLVHLFLHKKLQKNNETKTDIDFNNKKITKFQQEALLDSLSQTILSLKHPDIKTQWGTYYENTNYSDIAKAEKFLIVNDFAEFLLNNHSIKNVCDYGANSGEYSRIFSSKDIFTLALDIDSVAIEKNYLHLKKEKEQFILPLIQDLTNPSPDIGFNNKERSNIKKRFKTDVAMALALIHHLAISNNLPFENIANFFYEMSEFLIIEFVPKKDSKVQFLLQNREDIFFEYTQENFENIFKKYFDILEVKKVKNSRRIIYLMKKRNIL